MTPASKRYFRYFTYIEPVLKAPMVKTYGSLILTFISLTVFIIFAIKPTFETILILQKKLSDQKETLKQLEEKTQNLRQGIENYQKLDDSTKNKIDTAVPKKLDLSTLISSLELTALSSQASVSALQFQPILMEKSNDQSFESKLAEIEFTFNLEGAFDKQKKALQSLNISSRLISINGLILNKVEGGGLLMSIKGKAYYLK